MKFNQKDYDNYMRKVICYGVKEIKDSGYKTFTDTAVIKAFHLSSHFVNMVLQSLINSQKILRIYRVYNPKNNKEYIDFTDVDAIPKQGYISDKSKGLKFKINKYSTVGVFYTFPDILLKKNE